MSREPTPPGPWQFPARPATEWKKKSKSNSGSRAALARAKTKEGRGEAASLFQIPSRQPNSLRSVTGNLSEVGR
ncbi:TPA: hypothetical protein ACG453_004100, partial [Stenotrophomonas maltophilia]